MRPALRLSAAVLAGAFQLAACQLHKPAVISVNARLYVEPGEAGGRPVEKLSFFASLRDEDGAGDIEYLYLVHDLSELSWKLDAAEWTRRDDGQSVWFGSNAIYRPDGLALPRGDYRAIAVDMSGERAEYRFALSAPPTEGYSLPTVSMDGGAAVRIASGFAITTAFFLDAGGNVVKTANAAAGRNELSALWGGADWRSQADYLAVYGLDPKSEVGFFSWKLRLPD